MNGGEMDDLFGFDDNAPLTDQEKQDLLVPAAEKEKKPCPVCGKLLTWTADGKRPRQHKCKEAAAEAPAQLNMDDYTQSQPVVAVTFGAPGLLPDQKPPLTVDEVVAKYVATRDLIAEKTKALEKELETLKGFQKNREMWLLGKLDASGVESMRTSHGTCFVDWKDSVSVADADAFMGWVGADWAARKTFLENRVSKTAVKQRLSENELPPPGVNYTKIKDVKIRRA